MKPTLSNVKELKRASTNPLTKHVCNYVIDRWGDYDNKRYLCSNGRRPYELARIFGRLYRSVNEMDGDSYEQLYNLIGKQDFKDPLDVVLCLEC